MTNMSINKLWGSTKKHESIIVTVKPVCCKPGFHKLKVMLFPYMVRKGAAIKVLFQIISPDLLLH